MGGSTSKLSVFHKQQKNNIKQSVYSIYTSSYDANNENNKADFVLDLQEFSQFCSGNHTLRERIEEVHEIDQLKANYPNSTNPLNEVKNYISEYMNMKDVIDEIKAKFPNSNNPIEDLLNELRRKDEELERANETIRQKDEELETTNKRIEEIKKSLKKLLPELEDTTDDAMKYIEKINEEMESLKEENEKMKRELTTFQQENEHINNSLRELLPFSDSKDPLIDIMKYVRKLENAVDEKEMELE